MSQVAKRQDTAIQPQMEAGPVALMRMIESASVNPDVDVTKLERMWAMYDAERKRVAEQAFNAALAAMQADMPTIREGGKIAHGGRVISTYGRWDEDILPVVKPILNEHGFGLSFRVNTDDKVRVEAVLSHREGHSERTSITLPADTSGSKNPVQAVASSVSYGKRYTAGSLLNLEIHGQDDDGNSAADSGLSETLKALGTAPTMGELQSAFKAAWNSYTSAGDRKKLTAAKDQRKKELTNG